MRALGIHQGLAPVLDVVRDPRWGRVDECIARGPVPRRHDRHVVRARPAVARACTPRSSTSSATPARSAGRNFAPVHAGPREVADVLLLAVRDGGPRRRRALGHALVHRDRRRAGRRRPAAAHRRAARPVGLRRHGRRRLLRRRVPAPPARAWRATSARPPARRSRPGVDIELPTGDAYLDAARRGGPRRARSTRRSSTAPCCGCCGRRTSSGCSTRRSTTSRRPTSTSTRPSTARSPRRLAEESVVLLSNDGTLPLAAPGAGRGHRPERRPRRGAVRLLLVPQPRARRSTPGVEVGSRRRRCSRRCAAELARRRDRHGARLRGRRRRPVRLRRGRRARRPAADVAVLVVGDHAGLFGRGTVGEGCDRDDLELPGVQRELVEAVLATGHARRAGPAHRPAVRGRLGARRGARPWCRRSSPARRAAAPSPGVLSGRVNPSGHAAGQPAALRRRAAVLLPAPAAGRGRRRHQPAHHARRCRSGTGCRTRRSRTPTSTVDAQVADRRRASGRASA